MKLFGIAALLMLTCVEVFAQTHPRSKALIDSVSMAMCKCMDKTFLSVDDEVKELIMQVVKDPVAGQQKIQDYLVNAGDERAAVVMSQLEKLGSIDSDLTMCFNASTARLENLANEIEGLTEDEQTQVLQDFDSEQKVMDLLMEGMHEQEGCDFAYQFIKLGLELEKK